MVGEASWREGEELSRRPLLSARPSCSRSRGQVALQALKLVGPKALQSKTVIDACNPIGGGPPINGVLSYFTTLTDSLEQAVASLNRLGIPESALF